MTMRLPARLAYTAAAALALATLPSAPAFAQDAIEPAPLEALIADIDIPYEKFTLDNGLQVLVIEDRSAPMVAVGVWYDVGSKHEPSGQHRLCPSVRTPHGHMAPRTFRRART